MIGTNRGTTQTPSGRTSTKLLCGASFFAIALLGLSAPARAQDVYWDPNNTTAGSGGTGTWNTTDPSWSDSPDGATGPYNAWDNLALDNAIFGGTAGTVTLGEPITVHNITFATPGYQLTGGTLTLAGVTPTITNNVGVNLGISSVIAGTDGLTKAGAGTLFLNGVNTYTGVTTILLSTLSVGTIGNGGVASGIGASSSASANLVFNGGALQYTGATTSTDRGFTLAGTGQIIVPSALTTLTFGGTVVGGGSLTKTGSGTLVLSGTNTRTGNTSITAGVLQAGSTQAFGPGNISLLNVAGARLDLNGFSNTIGGLSGGGAAGGNVTLGSATLTIAGPGANYSGIISGTGGVTRTGTGVQTFTGCVNTYTGPTTVGAPLTVSCLANGGAASGLGASSNAPVNLVIGSTLSYTGGTVTTDRGFTLTGTSGIISVNTAATTLQFTGAITGTGSLRKTSAGTLVLSGSNTATGDTRISGGILRAGSTNALNAGVMTLDNAASAVLDLEGFNNNVAALSGGGTTGGNVQLDAATLTLDSASATTQTYAGAISGTGGLVKAGDAGFVQRLSGCNSSYTGVTTITSGELEVSCLADGGVNSSMGASAASPASLVLNGGTLDYIGTGGSTNREFTLGTAGGALSSSGTGAVSFASAAAVTLAGTDTARIFTLAGTNTGDNVFHGQLTDNGAGATSLAKSGGGTWVLTGANTYTGGTTINSGTLQIGHNNFSGSIVGNVVNNGTLAFGRTNFYTFDGVISASGNVHQRSSGTTTLTADNTYTGSTTISAGTLLINGDQSAATGLTTVASGATLGGNGVIGGNVVIADGGTLSPGNTPGTTTIVGDLTLNSASILDYEFGQANVVGGPLNDLTNVGGSLTLDGTINVTVPAGGSFDVGVYRVFNYGGTLTDNTLELGTLPAGDVFVQTSIAGQINLVNQAGLTLNYWDGATGPKNNGVINGGTGIWQDSSGNDNWTEATGAVNAPFTDLSFAIFSATPGTVTVDNGVDAVTASGLQFASDGYVITGDALTLDGGAQSIVRVGDGTPASAGYTATIDSVLAGATQLVKTDLGTLVLSGVNTYTGGTLIDDGTVRISIDANLGDAAGALAFDGGTLHTTADIASNRSVDLIGPGTLLTEATTTLTLGGVVSGAGALTKDGAGTTVLTGANSYNGGTTITAGTLQLGDGGTTGSIVGDVVNNATLAFNRSDTVTFAGLISGSGGVNQDGAGTTILTGSNSYAGATSVNAGTLLINGDQTAATGLTSAASGATLGGIGTIGGDVTIADGGTLMPGAGGVGTLTINGDLSLAGTSLLAYEFGQANTVGGPLNDLVNVGGDLTLDGTIDVTVSVGGSFDVGIYRVISYGGALTNNGLSLGTMPPGADVFVQTSIANQVNLVNTAGLTLNYWDGAAGPKNNGAIDGGSGTWQASTGNDNWTEVTGALNAPFTDAAFAIFSATPGTVTIDNSLGAVTALGMQFASDGYVLTGGDLTLVGPQSIVRVGDGTAAGTGMTATIGAALTGATQLVKTDLGTLVLTGVNTYTGGTTIDSGTLQLGDGATSGSIVGDVVTNGTLAFNRSDVITFAGLISGTGAVDQIGSGTTVLTGTNSYAGATSVSAGTLLINSDQSAATGLTSVASGATLGGTGTIGGDVAIADGGTLAPGSNDVGTLTINGNLAFSGASLLAYEFGQSSIVGGPLNDLTEVGGDLVLDGTIDVAVTPGGSFDIGLYRVISYGGTLIDNGLSLGTMPAGSDVSVQTSIASQVNLVNTAGLTLNFWDGAAGPKNNGAIDGGNGTWQASTGNDNWTETTGALNAPFTAAAFAIFSAAPGTVAIDNSLGAVTAAGVQFASDGYVLTGGDLTLTGPQAVVRVGDGTLAGTGMTATIGAALTGATQLVKTGLGTLVLTGANTYTGGTMIDDGTLRISSDANMGAASGSLAFDGGTLNTTASISSGRAVNLAAAGTLLTDSATTLTLTGATSGGGSLIKSGAGTLVLGGTGGHMGGTNVTAGTLLANGNHAGATTVAGGAALGGAGTIGGDVTLADGATLTPGAGGTGTLAINGDLSLSGGTRLAYEFGQANIAGGALNDLVNVGGDLVLDGTIDVTVPASGSFDVGIHRVFNYGGALTNNGLTLGALPTGSAVAVQTSIAGQVNLVNSAGLVLNFWDGAASPKNNGVINGGNGTWQTSSGNDNWTEVTGAVNAPYADGAFAIFGGAGGTVTVDGSLGAITAAGMQFTANGYTIGGDGITLFGPQSTIRVGDGTAAGAGFTATINSVLDGATQLVKTDAGTLVLGGTNTYTGGTLINGGTVQIASDANLGAAAGDVMLDGGTLATSANLTSARDIVLAGAGTVSTASGTTFTLDGLLSGSDALTKAGAGTLLLTGNNSAFAGSTQVEGTLTVNGSLCGDVNVLADGRLEGTGTVCTTVNAGTVAPGNSIGTLTVAGSYTGTSGTLEIEAELGGDSSPTDRLVVTGGTSGATDVIVINAGGLGAQTIEGIKIVDVTGGASSGTFALRGDYIFEGSQAVIAGAYGYRLFQNGASTPTDGDWYLRSALLDGSGAPQGPLYQPGVPLYESYASTLQTLNGLPTLQERVGNRQWSGFTNSGVGMWGRIEGSRHRPEAAISTSGTDLDVNNRALQVGFDATLLDGPAGVLIAGVNGRYGTTDARIRSRFGNGGIDTDGFGIGATLTWYGASGFYADAQVQRSWYDSHLDSDALGSLVRGNDGSGEAFSLEVGKRLAIGSSLSITPQAQIVYSNVRFGQFVDPAGTMVSAEEADSLRGRLGLSLDHQKSRDLANGNTARTHLYGFANLDYEMLDGTRVDVSGTPLLRRDDRLWGELGIGGSYSWADGRFTIFSEVSANTALSNFGDSNTLKGNAGFRMRF